MRKIFGAILLITLWNWSFAQLATNSAVSANFLVQNILLGNGVSASNISYTGHADAIGSFNGSNSNIGLGAGIIMTTGTVKNEKDILGNQQGPFGPNNEDGAGVDNGQPGYALLDNISSASTKNAAVLEFDFDAVGNSISFNYVFASEEYLEYVNAGYNDVFGFFISGPNPGGGNYVDKNIAIIPGTTLPVSIDNLNNQSYSQYYINNGDGFSAPQNSDSKVVQYDGFTKVLNAYADVVCGATYHIKIAIADAGDGVWDSGVFLEEQSFNSTPALNIQSNITTSGSNIPNQMTEGCSNAVINFIRNDSINYAQTFQLSYSGAATMGVDVDNLPSSISFNPGQSSQSISFSAIYDQLTEGIEDLVITVSYFTYCGDETTSSINLTIIDQDPIILNMLDQTTIECPGTPEYLVAYPQGGVPPYSYLWSTGETTSSISVSPLATQTYYLTVSDACGPQSISDSILVIIPTYDPIEVNLTNDTSLLCPNTPLDIFSTVSGGAGGYSWSWSTNEVDTNITVQTMTTNSYTVNVTDMCGNEGFDSILVTIIKPVLQTAAYGSTAICPGDTISIGVMATSGAGYYEYTWSTGATNSDIEVTPNQTTIFYVNVSDSCSTYDVVDSVTVNINQPIAQFDILPSTAVVGEEVQMQNTSIDAISYYWELGNSNTSTETNPITSYNIDGETEIMLIAYDDAGCTDTAYLSMTIYPKLNFYVPNAFTPDGDGKNELFRGIGVGIKEYQLRIFDRWGKVIFESNNERDMWDGTIGGVPVPEGIYVWQYELLGYDGTEFKRIGHVSLIR